jgi:hypothetical protein
MSEGATSDPLEAATRILADARRRCADLGLTPMQFAEILLPEALLACMVAGMKQEEVEALFGNFAHDEIPEWFLRVKKTSGFCDCAREAFAEHAAGCASLVTVLRDDARSPRHAA